MAIKAGSLFFVDSLQKMIKYKRLYITYRNKFRYFGHGYMTPDVNGKPKGVTWFVICTGLGNFRLFPVGFVK